MAPTTKTSRTPLSKGGPRWFEARWVARLEQYNGAQTLRDPGSAHSFAVQRLCPGRGKCAVIHPKFARASRTGLCQGVRVATMLVTGATGGIGRALVRLLDGRGYGVIAVGRNAARLAELPGRPLVADLRRPETLAAAVAGIDRLDGLVHCAGFVRLGAVADIPYPVWAEHLTVNLAAPAELTRALLPALRAARGRVVFVNSGAGLRANPHWSAYAASKQGLRALADSLRAEEAGSGVRVSSVFPGRTATAMQRGVRAAEGGEYRESEYLRAETVAAAVLAVLEAPDDAEVTEVVLRPAGAGPASAGPATAGPATAGPAGAGPAGAGPAT